MYIYIYPLSKSPSSPPVYIGGLLFRAARLCASGRGDGLLAAKRRVRSVRPKHFNYTDYLSVYLYR